ncbi:hypothetical protein IAT38_001539 [Cryptococcus sp. DSM 104549]
MNHSVAERKRREEHQQRAYEIQRNGGIIYWQGAIQWTIYGAAACALGHYSWPLFARQTLGLKAFLTSSATMYGLVVGADDHLLRFEQGHRDSENEIRRQARHALALEGKIATESEIRKWREKKEAKERAEQAKEGAGLGMVGSGAAAAAAPAAQAAPAAPEKSAVVAAVEAAPVPAPAPTPAPVATPVASAAVVPAAKPKENVVVPKDAGAVAGASAGIVSPPAAASVPVVQAEKRD